MHVTQPHHVDWGQVDTVRCQPTVEFRKNSSSQKGMIVTQQWQLIKISGKHYVQVMHWKFDVHRGVVMRERRYRKQGALQYIF